MRLILITIFLFSFFSSGCFGQQKFQHPDLRSGSTQACNQADFRNFFDLFSVSTDVQKACTRFPLEKLEVDPLADPEPAPQEFEINDDQIDFPIFPSPSEIHDNSLEMEIFVSGNKVKVRLFKPDTDYLIEYFFEFEKCWYLTRIEDWSL